jgi:hypothetical protein
MFDYLQQFNSLPKDLRDRVSSPTVMAILGELENKYQVDLAMVIMKVMIKSLAVKNLPAYFVSELGLNGDQAEALFKELKEKIFVSVADYLGILTDMRALDLEKDIAILIKETGLTLPSENLISRFKNILATYLKGVRSKIDTRATLAKDAKTGGLGLNPVEIERVFKVCETQKFKSLETSSFSPSSVPLSRLDKIIATATPAIVAIPTPTPISTPIPTPTSMSMSKIVPSEEYNLKRALENGQVKKSLPIPEKQLDLPQPEEASSKPSAAPIAPVPPKPTVVPPSPRPTVINRPVITPTASKPKMQDIRPVPKVMGPLEELQFLDLINFRRLGKTPGEITAKIFSKIKFLEREGYEKMVAGVKAWRQSPVNRLYLRLGQEAITKGITLKEALAARQKAGQECLSLEEIEAIVAMNGKLVF